MPATRLRTCIAVAALSALPAHPVSGQTRVTRPNDVGGEIGGQGIVLTLAYQRMLTPWAAVQLGWFGNSEPRTEDEAELLLTPNGKLYLPLGDNAPFLTGGITVKRSPPPIRTEAFPFVGVGYERRSSGGFVFRATLYLFVFDDGEIQRYDDSIPAPSRVFPWPGFYFGYAF